MKLFLAIALSALTGCANGVQSWHNPFGSAWASGNVTATCPGGTQAVYTAPMGLVLGSVAAECDPGPGGTEIAKITSTMGVDLASVITALVKAGVIAAPMANPPIKQQLAPPVPSPDSFDPSDSFGYTDDGKNL